MADQYFNQYLRISKLETICKYCGEEPHSPNCPQKAIDLWQQGYDDGKAGKPPAFTIGAPAYSLGYVRGLSNA
jgi:hypothetical protein